MKVFAVKKGRKYLQGFDYNEKYKKQVRAIGYYNPHGAEEFKAIWGDETKYFDARTLRGYLELLVDNRKWEHEKFDKITIVVGDE